MQNPPVDILPGTSEAFGGHKESYAATGCSGLFLHLALYLGLKKGPFFRNTVMENRRYRGATTTAV